MKYDDSRELMRIAQSIMCEEQRMTDIIKNDVIEQLKTQKVSNQDSRIFVNQTGDDLKIVFPTEIKDQMKTALDELGYA